MKVYSSVYNTSVSVRNKNKMDFNKYTTGVVCLILMLHLNVCAGAASVDEGCSDKCLEPDDGLACDLITKSCLYGCKDGFAGPDCSQKCCSNCKTCTANESTSVLCYKCMDGFFLDRGVCMPCSRWCANGTCRAVDGHCDTGCQEGYYGNTCAEQCSDNCKDRMCRADNGVCSNGCSLSVLHGPRCSKACNEGCIKRECDQNGICIHGCNDTAWGPDCSMRCSNYCSDPQGSNVPICNATDGQCLYGCVNQTYWGGNCTRICNPTCQGQKCDSETGECTDGCTEGYKGPNCSEKNGPGLSWWKILLIVIGGFGLLVLVFVIVVCAIGLGRQ